MRKVLDTNVFIDIHSCHDLVAKFDDRHGAIAAAAVGEKEVVYRRARAREALLLAIYLHNVKATTYTLQGEALRVLERAAPPSAKGGTWLPSDHLRFFIGFVKDRVLGHWDPRFCMPKKGGNWPKLISNDVLVKGNLLAPDHEDVLDPTGNRADLFHIAMAKERRLDLIATEGFSPEGYGTGKIAVRARGEGVRTLFPRDVYAGRMNESYAAHAFMERFRREAPIYLAERERERGADLSGEFMSYMAGYYRHVLFGEIEGSDRAVAVSIYE